MSASKEKDTAIKVEHLTKSFRIPLERSNGIKRKVINTLKGRKGYREFTPLRDISFEIKKGEFFGIVGRNGSGKSTLLKSIAGIYTTESGKVSVNGTLVPFIELGVGFNPELSGRENVYLNGALLGFSRKEMDSMYNDIVDFAELHDFMEERLKNYSSGMQVRLAFSIAIRSEADILLLDEVLAVGDEAFQRKCFSYFADLKKKKTVILVTHSMASAEQFCDRAMLIDGGKVQEIGNVADVADRYRRINMPNESMDTGKENDDKKIEHNSNSEVELKIDVKPSKKIRFNIVVETKIDLVDVSVAFIINRQNGEMVYRWALDENVDRKIDIKKDERVDFNLEIQNIFPDGEYSVRAAVRKRDKSVDYIIDDTTRFSLVTGQRNASFWKPEESKIEKIKL